MAKYRWKYCVDQGECADTDSEEILERQKKKKKKKKKIYLRQVEFLVMGAPFSQFEPVALW
jgi:hypothetical protein